MQLPVNNFNGGASIQVVDTRCSWLLALLLLSSAGAQQQQQAPKGVIYGVVFTFDGAPARALTVMARPSSPGGHSGGFPRTKTNAVGEYRFQKLSWGTYLIYADDKKAGYSRGSTGPLGDALQIEITPEHPEAEFNLSLPARAGFIQVHLSNRRTGAAIAEMTLSVLPLEKPDSGLFSLSGRSDELILVPPDRNLLLHVKADGFQEWDRSVGAGMPVNVPSGSTLSLDVPLEPLD